MRPDSETMCQIWTMWYDLNRELETVFVDNIDYTKPTCGDVESGLWGTARTMWYKWTMRQNGYDETVPRWLEITWSKKLSVGELKSELRSN